jgi:hypothetical protein
MLRYSSAILRSYSAIRTASDNSSALEIIIGRGVIANALLPEFLWQASLNGAKRGWLRPRACSEKARI